MGNAANDDETLMARQRASMPQGTGAILNRRTLATSHGRLAELLQPGMEVLDVGCGNGAITSGIAAQVGADGRVVGVDVNAPFIFEAKETYRGVPGLHFEVADVYDLPYDGEFDVVTAARVLQWLAQPHMALESMVRATKVKGRVVILDYNHTKIEWEPEPPAEVQRFYDAFLHWRTTAGMDNTIADRLPAMMADAGLTDIHISPQHEHVARGDVDFHHGVILWADVMASRGLQMVADGFLTEKEREAAERTYREWAAHSAQRQRMYLLAVEGTKP